MATGSSIVIHLRREQARLEQNIRYCAWDTKAIDRYNYIRELLLKFDPKTPVERLTWGTL